MYLDNASTSYPKPDCVKNGILNFFSNGEGSFSRSYSTEDIDFIYSTRKKLAHLLNIPFPNNIVFTQNSTEALNLIIDGFLNENDEVITTAIEHNSVIRPLIRKKEEENIRINWIKCDGTGYVDANELISKINPNTKLVIMNHVSNVTGMTQEIEKVGQYIKELENTSFLVDASQSLGHELFNNANVQADFIAFTGHKALLGTTGIGGCYINPSLDVRPLKVGGTGVLSELLVQPIGTPLHYESGTLNSFGIISLYHSLDYLSDIGIYNIQKFMISKTEQIINKLKAYKEIILYSEKNASGIVSFNINGLVPSRVSHFLLENYGIITRSGMMCAPFIHEFLQDGPFGCVRISLSYETSDEEIKDFMFAISEIIDNIEKAKNINIPTNYDIPSIYNN